MTEDTWIVDQAEEYIKQGEEADLTYPDAASRAQAKLQLIESMTKKAKQENIPEASAASESGGVVGASGGTGTLAEIDAELDRLRALPPSQETMKKRTELSRQKKELIKDVGPEVLFGR